MTTKAREPADPVLNTGLWRGEVAPPFEPPASRAAAGATDGRTGAQPWAQHSLAKAQFGHTGCAGLALSGQPALALLPDVPRRPSRIHLSARIVNGPGSSSPRKIVCRYPISDDISIMLIDEAILLSRKRGLSIQRRSRRMDNS